MTVLEALKEMGFDLKHPARGSIMIERGPIKVKRYAFRYRVGDGHVLTRAGRVVGVRKLPSRAPLFVFQV